MSDDRTHATPMPTAPADGTGGPVPVSTQLRTVAVCDLVESTALVERLGDRRAADLFRRHDRMARDLLHRHHGREIDKTDGFLLLFERPVSAVAFALDYQRGLRDLAVEEKVDLAARIGVHVGDVLLWENVAEDVAKGAKPTEVEGLAKPLAARLMHLARPGQVLLSGMAHTLALRAQQDLGPLAERVRWLGHGRYRFKGLPAPLLVYEAGEPGIAPLKAPPSSSKAQRELPLWRRPRALVVEAVLGLAAVLALAFVFVGRPQPAIAFGERDWVVLGDLRNLTGDPTVEDALETAFRISLEQSRFVNVMPDLALRNALARMQESADVPLDREVGSEVAVREGARALILPTVADIGGRIRVSAEIVDPHTQTTVYAESADGVGLESSLASMDLVAARLRLSLGETLQAIERDSAPLPKVTTASLDALRAYGTGVEAQARGEFRQSMTEYQNALTIDPDFALAHLGLARVAMSQNDRRTAKVHIERAALLRDRLTSRDALYADAWSHTLQSPARAVEKWGLLAELYPDFFAGSFNSGLYAALYENRYADAVSLMQPALAEQNPFRGGVHYDLGWMHAALGEFEAADGHFSQARALGHQVEGVYHALSLVARRRYDRALSILDASQSRGVPAEATAFSRALIALDQGDFEAFEQLSVVAEQRHTDPALASAVRVGRIAALAVVGRLTVPDELRNEVQSARIALQEKADPHADQALYGVLLAGYAAARSGMPDLAERALEIADGSPAVAAHPNVAAMVQATRAQLLLSGGKPEEALALIGETAGTLELYQTRATRLKAARASGRTDLALIEARWLAGNRGRALLEWGVNFTQSPLNLVDSVVAEVEAAEILHLAGRRDDAIRSLMQVQAHWGHPPPAFTERIAALRTGLALE